MAIVKELEPIMGTIQWIVGRADLGEEESVLVGLWLAGRWWSRLWLI